MINFTIFLIAIVTVSASTTDNEQWTQFRTNYGKDYRSSVEERHRFTIFQENLRKIITHNKKFEAGLSTFKMGITQFADLTADEFQERLKLSKRTELTYPRVVQSIEVQGDLPAEFDWRPKGAVTDVKDQGGCGSCWTFSTTGTVEGAYFLKTGNLASLSEQNLVDCAKDNCNGCEGGWMDKALEYIKENGIMQESDYPYEGRDDTCRFNKTKSVLSLANFVYVEKNDEDDLQKAVAVKGPVSVAIDASWNFQLYDSGILDDDTCLNSINNMNHGVLVVGYGTENGKDFWIVKNSWGPSWGESGYIRMTRNKDNQCGIATDGTYPIL